jgi:hemerythrin superfamily protein
VASPKQTVDTVNPKADNARPGHRSANHHQGKRPPGGNVDALSLLKHDHELVKRILNEGEATTERAEKTRTELFARLKSELEIHERIEEEVLYPALRDHPKSKEIALEGYEEHHVVDTILAELEMTPVSDETWGAKFKVAKENLEHHIEEEEGEMFTKTRQIFSEQELEEMGARMAEIKALGKQVAQSEG